jgi:hypothetical protein
MSITQTITALPTAPNPATDDDATFQSKAETLLTAQAAMVGEMNTAIGQINTTESTLNSIAAGSAYSFSFGGVNSSTSDADPGAGKIAFDNFAAQTSATVLRLSKTDGAGRDRSTEMGLLGASTSATKGRISVQKSGDGSTFLSADVTAVSAHGGTHYDLTISNIAGSSAAPFAATDPVIVKFTRTGDKGDQGIQGLPGNGLVLLATATPTGVATCDFTASIDGTYEEYELHLQNVVPATNNVTLTLRTSANSGGAWDSSASAYDWVALSASATVTSSAGDTSIRLGSSASDTPNTASTGGVSGVVRIFDPAGTTSNKQISAALVVGAAGLGGVSVSARRLATAAVNGLRLLFTSGNIASGKVKLYGVKKS